MRFRVISLYDLKITGKVFENHIKMPYTPAPQG